MDPVWGAVTSVLLFKNIFLKSIVKDISIELDQKW